MKNYAYGQLVDLISFISAFNSTAASKSALRLADDQLVLVKLKLTRFKERAIEADLPVVSRLAGEALFELGHGERDGAFWKYTGQNFHNLLASVGGIADFSGRELDAKLFLALTPSSAALLKPTVPHFGDEVRTKFAMATYDIDEAAMCLAFGRSTACVFHAMRVMEVALRAVQQCLGAVSTPRNNWGDILKSVRDERDRRGKGWKERDYFQEVYARLDAVKDAWRNSTMHVENVYTEDDARSILSNVESFMRKIASRMDEAGLPPA